MAAMGKASVLIHPRVDSHKGMNPAAGNHCNPLN